MLDPETKKRIDNARDILVGKVPDPKSQVEQITIALIYKFMDDMDQEAVELGGKASFFQGDYEKYAWSHIFDPRLSGYDLINLYGEAIGKMNENPHIPQLFRDIFKNAYLPYRDPETLKSFLKEINEFTYDHSERLGDAFEMLLMVLGSQGDAGQFRTPRNIIDFIVDIVAPDKHETILDPACGTAGFLISAYKHILQRYTSKQTGDKLTADDRKQLMNNFAGYDISPDMVRLALVNLYLHGFPSPKINEYDTLTSEDKWHDIYDVILANPPFMTPKGGIKPHKRFTVQANRSEVLFVDYIAEHITSSGRAAIIVPEGIIFQSANAYKNLRKMLVDSGYLWAVVSLPAGVFNPYSGVKTSILFLDRTLAKKTDNILFVKVNNDGFDLGAQRRENGKDDLPTVTAIMEKYKASLVAGHTVEITEDEAGFALVVPKEKIGASGDYNLTGERYREVKVSRKQKWPMVRLGEVCKFSSGKFLPQKNFQPGIYPVYGGNGITGTHNEYLVERKTLIIGRVGEYCGSVYVTQPMSWITDNALYVTEYYTNVDQTYLMYVIRHANLNQYAKIGGQPSIAQGALYEVQIPLPPLPVQQEIVAEIEGYRKIIDGARQVVDNYKPRIASINQEKVPLSAVAKLMGGFAFPGEELKEHGDVPVIKIGSVWNGKIEANGVSYINKNWAETKKEFVLKIGDIVVAMTRPIIQGGLKYAIIDEQYDGSLLNQRVGKFLIDTNSLLPDFLALQLQSDTVLSQITNLCYGNSHQPNLSSKDFESINISLPTLDEQRNIIAICAEERRLVDANRKLIEIFEAKIQAKLAEVWGE